MPGAVREVFRSGPAPSRKSPPVDESPVAEFTAGTSPKTRFPRGTVGNMITGNPVRIRSGLNVAYDARQSLASVSQPAGGGETLQGDHAADVGAIILKTERVAVTADDS